MACVVLAEGGGDVAVEAVLDDDIGVVIRGGIEHILEGLLCDLASPPPTFFVFLKEKIFVPKPLLCYRWWIEPTLSGTYRICGCDDGEIFLEVRSARGGNVLSSFALFLFYTKRSPHVVLRKGFLFIVTSWRCAYPHVAFFVHRETGKTVVDPHFSYFFLFEAVPDF